MTKPINERPHRNATRFVAIGYRYNADGWTEKKDLFVFWADQVSQALQEAKDLRVRGSGGCARHGCEDVTAVRYA